jgi:hypothetical protein
MSRREPKAPVTSPTKELHKMWRDADLGDEVPDWLVDYETTVRGLVSDLAPRNRSDIAPAGTTANVERDDAESIPPPPPTPRSPEIARLTKKK